jgi:hypothetical protein
MNVLINVSVFKLAWLSTVFGGANELPLLGLFAAMLAVGIHLRLVPDPLRELTLILMTGVIGLVIDSVMVAAGWLTYSSGVVVAGLAPYWIMAMWMLFATTLNVSFRWLQSRLWAAALMGAVFGPVAYLGGSAAGAVTLSQPFAAMTALSVAWAIMMPGLLLLAQQLDGTRPVTPDSIPEQVAG